MHLLPSLFFVGCLAFFLASPSPGRAEEDEAVVTLTESNFDDFIKENPEALVEFYAPWCGHCKKLAPEYEKAAKALKGKVPLGKVDATVEKDLASKFNVRGYPTLKFFKKGKEQEYTGGRSEETIIQWIETHTGPAVSVVDKATEVSDEKPTVFVVKTKDAETKLYKDFEAAADVNRESGLFQAILGDKSESLSVFRKDEGETVWKESEYASLDDFVYQEAFPLFGKIDGSNHRRYVNRKNYAGGLFWLCLSPDEYKKFGGAAREAAKNFKGDLSFVWLNLDELKSHAETAFGLTEFPAYVLEQGKARYVLESGGKDPSAASLKGFLEDVKAGKIKRTLKSEETPESNDAPVKVVTANTFDSILFESGKDVFFEIYAPWCGHCKKLEPIYTEFAEKMEKDLPSLLVTKMDGTQNDVPYAEFDFRGFPTIYYLKADDVKKAKEAGKPVQPAKYQGGRAVDDLVKYAKENVSPSLKKEEKPSHEEL
uniref:Protein disulfide-isomerase n=1 Tax=Chromera velia CCMP2878 TaxID=1169474 RepID=A0A0G4IFW8_9ALVE|eukprot:Cvel_14049.t1-p1 / transcript=Cvel_14049.t1 / gene=Cvel_14049 / organism=Chromera_velia_CCMP2878 / gene_product=Protein disulfide-isomerase A3, putative / transcript_product=Protein disulfide-isomerase A3, putative / location=Cvel_scaffold985:17414-22544(+) / protein_length=483 / sequence_SO=supercontig / SO=protein_coding / is_pseudo=false